jgi:hypothetical protein
MAKRLSVQASKSAFADILGSHKQAHGEAIPEARETAAAAPGAGGERKAGKSADPAYTKLTAYIRKDTHQAVKIRLLQEGQGREFSELVEELLSGWLKPV